MHWKTVLAVLVALVPLTVWWKRRLSPHDDAVDLTLAMILAVTVWILLHFRTLVPEIVEYLSEKSRLKKFLSLSLLVSYPAIHYYFFGGDLVKLSRWISIVIPLTIISFLLFTKSELKAVFFTYFISFLLLSFLAILEINSEFNTYRFFSLGISPILIGQAAGFGLMFAAIYGIIQKNYILSNALIILFSFMLVVSGSKAPILAVAAIVLLAAILSLILVKRTLFEVVKLMSVPVLVAVSISVFVFSPLIHHATTIISAASLGETLIEARQAENEAAATVEDSGMERQEIEETSQEDTVAAGAVEDSGMRRNEQRISHSIDRLIRATQGDLGETSAGTRHEIWELTIKTAVSNPLGVGFGNMKAHLTESLGMPIPYPHNIILEAWAELGLPGLFGLLILLTLSGIRYLRMAIQNPKDFSSVILICSFLFWLSQSLVSGDLTSSAIIFVLSASALSGVYNSEALKTAPDGMMNEPGVRQRHRTATENRALTQ